ncbi:MAG: DUF2231 domain-containing protein [Flavisolibacter sp.]
MTWGFFHAGPFPATPYPATRQGKIFDEVRSMRSKANLKSHPLHPMAVTLPICFFIGTFVFDLLSLFTQPEAMRQTGYFLSIAAVISAVLAAIPGAIDYFFTLPPKSSAKKRGGQHAVLNLANLALFIFALLYRQRSDSSIGIVLVAEGLGVILLGIAGWLGGTLVHRNQIGVDHRYAGAGKWKETYIDTKEKRIEAGAVKDLERDQMHLLHVNGERIVLARTEKGYAAFSDYCTHKGGSLADGALVCGTVQCPWHGSQFDVETGAVKAGPAREKIKTYRVEEKEGKVFLLL